MATRQERGRQGEDLAAEYLKGLGYRILERNWRWSRAEADIIAMEGEVLVFVEVKTRSSDHFGQPEEFVSPRKEDLLHDLASRYMEHIGHDWEIRFDIVSILFRDPYGHEIRHIRDAWF